MKILQKAAKHLSHNLQKSIKELKGKQANIERISSFLLANDWTAEIR